MIKLLLAPRMRSHRGFTLVELTVVMSIIAVLAAILFPVFDQAREAARKSACVTNLSQVGLALQLYARDHDGRFPPVDHDLRPLGDYLSDGSAYRCPSEWAPNMDWPGWKGRPVCSYQYRGGLSSDGRADLPLAADWEFRHSNTACVLSLSGSVRAVSTSNWAPVTKGPRPTPAGIPLPPDTLITPFLGEDSSKLPPPADLE